MTRPVRLLCALDTPLPPAQAVAESRALLEAAGAGGPETLRMFRVQPCLAFGPKDERAPGYPRALEAARSAGFAPVRRLEGGRAVAADPGTLGISWTIPDLDGRARIRPRFSLLAAIIAEALRGAGVAAEVGAVPGEYCPGDFSVGARGRVKLAGLGQRVTARAVHLGAFVVLAGAPRLRAVLGEVYAALGIAWDPRSLGSATDEAGAIVTPEALAAQLLEAAGRHLDFTTQDPAPLATRASARQGAA